MLIKNQLCVACFFKKMVFNQRWLKTNKARNFYKTIERINSLQNSMALARITNNDLDKTFSFESIIEIVGDSNKVIHVVATELCKCCEVIKK